MGFSALGLESAPEAVEIARREGLREIRCGSEDDLIESGESFDVVLLLHCLEHVPDPAPYLEKLRKLIRKSGNLIIQVPNRTSLQARIFGHRWYGLDCPRHVCTFTTEALRCLLTRCGYRVLGTRYFSLRDNAPAIVASLFPRLDPMARRVRSLRFRGRLHTYSTALLEVLFLQLVLLAQPLAFLEAGVGKGGTVTVLATPSPTDHVLT
jgi:SAM-dependent methyltransferase